MPIHIRTSLSRSCRTEVKRRGARSRPQRELKAARSCSAIFRNSFSRRKRIPPFRKHQQRFSRMGVDSLRFEGSNYHVWLKKDSGRALRNYEYDRTQHGRFLVRGIQRHRLRPWSRLYHSAFPCLDMPRLRDADIYIDGEMTHDRFDSSNRMVLIRKRDCIGLRCLGNRGRTITATSRFRYQARGFRRQSSRRVINSRRETNTGYVCIIIRSLTRRQTHRFLYHPINKSESKHASDKRHSCISRPHRTLFHLRP